MTISSSRDRERENDWGRQWLEDSWKRRTGSEAEIGEGLWGYWEAAAPRSIWVKFIKRRVCCGETSLKVVASRSQLIPGVTNKPYLTRNDGADGVNDDGGFTHTHILSPNVTETKGIKCLLPQIQHMKYNLYLNIKPPDVFHEHSNCC